MNIHLLSNTFWALFQHWKQKLFINLVGKLDFGGGENFAMEMHFNFWLIRFRSIHPSKVNPINHDAHSCGYSILLSLTQGGCDGYRIEITSHPGWVSQSKTKIWRWFPPPFFSSCSSCQQLCACFSCCCSFFCFLFSLFVSALCNTFW